MKTHVQVQHLQVAHDFISITFLHHDHQVQINYNIIMINSIIFTTNSTTWVGFYPKSQILSNVSQNTQKPNSHNNHNKQAIHDLNVIHLSISHQSLDISPIQPLEHHGRNFLCHHPHLFVHLYFKVHCFTLATTTDQKSLITTKLSNALFTKTFRQTSFLVV